MDGPVKTSRLNIIKEITYTTSLIPGKMGRFDVKNVDKTPSDAEKRENIRWREYSLEGSFFWEEQSTQHATGTV